MPRSKNRIVHLCTAELPDNFDVQSARLNPALERIDGLSQRANAISANRYPMLLFSRIVLVEYISHLFSDEQPRDWLLAERDGLPPLYLRSPSHVESSSAIKHNCGLKLSLSHSGQYLAIAIIEHQHGDDTRIGVDIERSAKAPSTESAELFCSSSELAKLSKFGDELEKQRELLRLWTQKEAFFKGHHQSIFNERLKSTRISPTRLEHATIHSVDINNDCHLSVYCPIQFSLAHTVGRINTHSEWCFAAGHKTNWEGFSIDTKH